MLNFLCFFFFFFFLISENRHKIKIVPYGGKFYYLAYQDKI